MRPSGALTRRGFLRVTGRMGVAAAAVAVSWGRVRRALARTPTGRETTVAGADNQRAILFDSTLCVGCRACEVACAEANGLGREPSAIFEGRPWEDARALAPDVLTYVTSRSLDQRGEGMAFGRVQCMHCLDPACAAACPVGALEKTPEGPVVWNGELCLGCRYCMMACPYQVPRFEWGSRNPRIRKCEMCHDRDGPACAAACPTGALITGRRADLLEEAWRRITDQPRTYVHRVYGEYEAGGANLLHLAAVPFADLGYREGLPNCSYCEFTAPVMGTIPYIVNGLGVCLGAATWVVHRRRAVQRSQAGEDDA